MGNDVEQGVNWEALGAIFGCLSLIVAVIVCLFGDALVLRFLPGMILSEGQSINGAPATVLPQVKANSTEPINVQIGPITFAEDVDKNNKPIRPGTSFASGLKAVNGVFNFSNMKDGLNWAPIWYLNGEAVISKTYKWDAGASGTQARTLSSKSSLPDGAYRLEIVVEGKIQQKGEFIIGSPIPTITSTREEGVRVSGTIVATDTGKPIPGAVFLVLQPDVTYDQWDGGKEAIFTLAQADERGKFQLPDLLPRGESYTIVAGAEGYNDNYEDEVAVDNDTPDSIDLKITLQKP